MPPRKRKAGSKAHGNVFLTRRAHRHLLEIETYSIEHWGEKRAKQYLGGLYKRFAVMAHKPEIGRFRQHRSSPFLMAPAEKHYAIYTETKGGIIIVAVLHSQRNIEEIIEALRPALLDEFNELFIEGD